MLFTSKCVLASFAQLNLYSCWMGDEGVIILCDALRENTASKVQSLGLGCNNIGPDSAKAIAALCAASTTLTELHVDGDSLGPAGKAMVRNAIKGREDSFELND